MAQVWILSRKNIDDYENNFDLNYDKNFIRQSMQYL